MGYTHYWSIKKRDSIPEQAQQILREILNQAYRDDKIQLEWNVHLPPTINDRMVQFNGLNGDHFAFCKTARKPYDGLVMRSLLILRYYMPSSFTLSSDGSFDDEWTE